jgi:hypothetical protein
MSELGRGRIIVKESRGHFIPDLPDFGKNQVGASRGAKSGQCDCGITEIFYQSSAQLSFVALSDTSAIGLTYFK